jgi:flagellar assembly protein FliH
MMTTSKSGPKNPVTPPATPAPNAYARFIPREELGGNVSAWSPQTFERPATPPVEAGVRKPTLAERAAAEVRPGMKGPSAHHAPQAKGQASSPKAAPATSAAGAPQPAARRPIVGGMPGQAEAQQRQAEAAAPTPPPNVEELLNKARKEGYQDGYRNGLAALESYKQTQAAQMAAHMSDQVGVLASDFHQRLESLEQQLAGRIAGVALELARQVVRTELKLHPELVVAVAEQALGALLASARQVIVRLHPEDHALALPHLNDMLAARGARLLPDGSLNRGGCVVESDIAVIDAAIEARWDQAAASMGYAAPWHDGHEARSAADAHPWVEDDVDGAAWPEAGRESNEKDRT